MCHKGEGMLYNKNVVVADQKQQKSKLASYFGKSK